MELCLLLEEVSRGLTPIGFVGVSSSRPARKRFGTEEQKQRDPRRARARPVEAIAMSEPEAGSDVGRLTCRAERANGGYVINGQKTWITCAHGAEHILLVCRTDQARGQARGDDDDLGADRVEGSRSGRSRRWAVARSTTCSSPTAGCPPTAARRPGPGLEQLMAGLNHERLIIAAQAWGWPSARSTTRSPTSRSASSSAGRSGRSRAPPPARGPRDRARDDAAAGLRRRGAGQTRTPEVTLPARGVDGEAEGDRDREASGARRDADDGRLRVPTEYDMEGQVRTALAPRSTAARARFSATSSGGRSG